MFSDRVHAGAETQVSALQLTAMVPMVEVVAAMLTASFLPGKRARVSLMIDHDALLKSGVVILAGVATIHRDLHGVQLVLRVLTRQECVIGDANVVVEKRHVLLKVSEN